MPTARRAGAAPATREARHDQADRLYGISRVLAMVTTTVLGRRLADDEWARLVAQHAVLQDADAAALLAFRDAFDVVSIDSGEELIRAGDPADALYVVLSGRLRVVVPGLSGSASARMDLSRGQTVGEIGLITGEPRSATVVALRDSILARLAREDFERLLAEHPRAATRTFTSPVIRRLRRQAEGTAEPTATRGVIVLVPVGEAGACDAVRVGMEANLLAIGSTVTVDRTTVEATLGGADTADAAVHTPEADQLVSWLNLLEAEHDHVVLQADPTWTPWTARCTRQADIVLFIGRRRDLAQPGPVEQELRTRRASVDLRTCLVSLESPYATVPVGSDQLLQGRAIDRLYHVRPGHDGDMRRLARLVAGRGVGMVLSGGGARAMAHIGVLRALEESGIHGDTVGGVSAGSVVGGLWAMGLGWAEMLDRMVAVVERLDYTLPIYAFLRGDTWTRALRTLFADVRIEDLWHPFLCLSANLSQASLVVHQDGRLLHAVRASTAIPGFLPPVYDNGDILADGGLMNNLPSDLVLADADVERVVAVDVGLGKPLPPTSPFEYGISGWQWLRQRRLRRSTGLAGVPSLGTTLQRSMLIANITSARATSGLAELTINPPVASYSLTAFEKAPELAEIGYQHTLEVLARSTGAEEVEGR